MSMSEQRIPDGGVVPEIKLHKRLEIALEHGNVHLDEMAAVIGYSVTQTRNFVKGRQIPRDGTITAWAVRCGVSRAWLRDGTVPSGPDGGIAPHVTSGNDVLNAKRTAQVIALRAAPIEVERAA